MYGTENNQKKAAIPGKFQLPISAEILQTKTKHECDEEAREIPRVVFKAKAKTGVQANNGLIFVSVRSIEAQVGSSVEQISRA